MEGFVIDELCDCGGSCGGKCGDNCKCAKKLAIVELALAEKKYLGETPIDISQHPTYSRYTPIDWAMYYIGRYGQIDGSHHKQWVLDRVARILLGTPVTVVQATWSNGYTEDRVRLADEPSTAYLAWVEAMLGDTDECGDREYSYDEGIAP